MNDSSNPSTPTRIVGAVALLAAGAIGGAIIAGTVAANAATPTATSSAAAGSSSATTDEGEQRGEGTFPAHGSSAHESAEKAVAGANATKAQAAAVKAVGSGTAGSVTSDFAGGGYEVTVSKADGSSVEVHLDQSFAVINHGGAAG